jgi:Tol biopolymer transport system component
LFGDRKPFPIAQTDFIESAAVFSPDGRWIAYTSNEAGQPNIYVQPFPAGGAKRQVSRDGGGQPVWRPDGKELFFLGPDGTMMAAAIDGTGQFGVPKALFPAIHPSALTLGTRQYAVTKDGERFLVNIRPQQSSVTPLTVVINWTAAIQN